MKNPILAILIFLFAILISCDPPSEEEYYEKRELEEFSRLKLSGAFNVNISQADQQSLTIEGSSELAEKLEVIQEGDLLELKLRGQDRSSSRKNGLRISLTIVDLEELEFEGAGIIKTTHPLDLSDFQLIGKGVGNIELDLHAENVDAKLNFVGNMVLRGRADVLRIQNEGLGNINASKLVAGNVDLNSSGIGNISLHCEDELSLQVNGIGKVSYTGQPTIIREEISGMAKVTRN